MTNRFIAIASFVLFATAAPVPAVAEEVWSGDMVDELMSPYCPGRTLRNCPSPEAGNLIDWIVDQEAQGRKRDVVYTQLLSEFGDEIRQAPEASGFGAAAYAIPIAAFLAGGAMVGVFLRHQRSEGAPSEAPQATAGAALDPELERLVDEELGSDS